MVEKLHSGVGVFVPLVTRAFPICVKGSEVDPVGFM